jgi:hypothetical protein
VGRAGKHDQLGEDLQTPTERLLFAECGCDCMGERLCDEEEGHSCVAHGLAPVRGHFLSRMCYGDLGSREACLEPRPVSCVPISRVLYKLLCLCARGTRIHSAMLTLSHTFTSLVGHVSYRVPERETGESSSPQRCRILVPKWIPTPALSPSL